MADGTYKLNFKYKGKHLEKGALLRLIVSGTTTTVWRIIETQYTEIDGQSVPTAFKLMSITGLSSGLPGGGPTTISGARGSANNYKSGSYRDVDDNYHSGYYFPTLTPNEGTTSNYAISTLCSNLYNSFNSDFKACVIEPYWEQVVAGTAEILPAAKVSYGDIFVENDDESQWAEGAIKLTSVSPSVVSSLDMYTLKVWPARLQDLSNIGNNSVNLYYTSDLAKALVDPQYTSSYDSIRPIWTGYVGGTEHYSSWDYGYFITYSPYGGFQAQAAGDSTWALIPVCLWVDKAALEAYGKFEVVNNADLSLAE